MITPVGTGKWSLYLIYWIAYLLFLSLLQGIPAGDFSVALTNELVSLPPKVIFVAVVVEILMDRLFFKKKVVLFVVSYTVLLFIFAFILRLVDNYIIINYFLTSWIKQPLLYIPPLLYNIIKLQFVVTIPSSIKLFSYWAAQKKRIHEIESDKMLRELEFLRNQFHPHFLFNMLNSLYSKILSKSDDSGEILLKISSMLRFSIYELKGRTISLKKEMAFLSDYITLQQTRFEEKLEVSFSVEGEIKDEVIEPFLLLPFIENSFKYCMDDFSENGWITIYIIIKNGWITAKIENSCEDRRHDGSFYTGVGLDQVIRRLELSYPDCHTLKVTNNGDSFFVILKIKLAAHAG